MKPTFNNLHTDFIFSMLRGTAAINEKKEVDITVREKYLTAVFQTHYQFAQLNRT